MDDFSYLVTINDQGPFHVREIRPKDFYLAQILRNEKKSLIPLFLRVLLNPEILSKVSGSVFLTFISWVMDNLFKDSIFSVENWFRIAFRLNKERWDSGIEWLENQPISKIKSIIEVTQEFGEEQEKLMKSK